MPRSLGENYDEVVDQIIANPACACDEAFDESLSVANEHEGFIFLGDAAHPPAAQWQIEPRARARLGGFCRAFHSLGDSWLDFRRKQ